MKKELILKRTDKYILFKCGNASSIVNAIFLRKKESEDCVFLSVPPTYKFGVKHNEYNPETKKWETVMSKDISATEMKDALKSIKVEDDDLPF